MGIPRQKYPAIMWLRPCNAHACVEIADINGQIGIRDSKDPDGPVLSFDRGEMSAFIAAVKCGAFDDLVEPSTADR
jgi:hypothetical protein